MSRLVNWLSNHWVSTVLGIVASILGIITFFWYLRDQKLATRVGTIVTKPSATRRYLSVGTARFVIDDPSGVFLRDHDDPLITMRLENGRLLVSATIRDARGDLVAELQDNEWSVNRNGMFDRNYTRHAVEVRDNQGHVALQVVSFDDTIHIAGVLQCRNRWRAVLAPDGSEGALVEFVPPDAEPSHRIPAICRYPSESNFAVCPGVADLQRIVRHGPGPAYRLAGSLELCAARD
jgi:hypothetical protein